MELLRALAALTDRPGRIPPELPRLLELPGTPDTAAHTDLFTFELSPYASIYLGEDGMLGGDARDRVAGFFRALSVTPPAEPDHLVVLLHAAADLADAETRATTTDALARHRQARTALLREHLLPWLPVYLRAVTATAAEPYRTWANLLAQTLRHQTDELGTGDATPAQLTNGHHPPDPRTSSPDELISALLAPVRTGMVLTRSTLARAAHDLGLALRIGERRYVLRALLEQDPTAVLAWLAQQAADAADAYTRELAWAGPSERIWRQRAQRTAEGLATAASDAARLRKEGSAPTPQPRSLESSTSRP